MAMRVMLADTETTGTDHEVDQIIEVAWIDLPANPAEFCAIRDPRVFPSFEQKYKPSVPMAFGAMATHHITPPMLDGCPSIDEFVYPANVDFLIGHNIDFDAKFFAGGMEDRRIDTLALSRWLFPDLGSHTQSAMIYYIASLHGGKAWDWARTSLRDAHTALADVHNCAFLLRFLIGVINERSDQAKVDHWEMLWTISEQARIPTIMGFGKHKGTPIELGLLDASYVSWYRRQAETDPYYLAAFKRAGF